MEVLSYGLTSVGHMLLHWYFLSEGSARTTFVGARHAGRDASVGAASGSGDGLGLCVVDVVRRIPLVPEAAEGLERRRHAGAGLLKTGTVKCFASGGGGV